MHALNESAHSYKQYVNRQSQKNPSLTNLCSFLESPDRYDSRIVCLDFYADSKLPRQRKLAVHPRTRTLGASLEDELCKPTKPCERVGNNEGHDSPLEEKTPHIYVSNTTAEPSIIGRMMIIEDLTTDIVETLGSCLDVDPLFFASHIHSTDKTVRSQAPELTTLPSRYKQNFVNIHYHRSVLLSGQSSRMGKLMRCCNVPRKLAILPAVKDAQFGLVQHCCSVLSTRDKEKRWLGIVLVDPPISEHYLSFKTPSKFLPQQVRLPSDLFLGGYEDFLPPPPYSADQPPQPDTHQPKLTRQTELTRHSILDDLLYYWSTSPPPTFSLTESYALFRFAYYPLKITASEWPLYLAILHRSIKEYEYRTKPRPNFLAEVERLNMHLSELQAWRRRALSSKQKLSTVIRTIAAFEAQSQSTDHHGAAGELKEDWNHLMESLEEYFAVIENMLPVLTSFAQIVDARRSFAETANISRLTILALIFVPLSFLASLFSMNAAYGPGGDVFWVYFVVAVPVTLLVFMVARPPARDLRRLWEFLGREVRRRRMVGREGERERVGREEQVEVEGRMR